MREYPNTPLISPLSVVATLNQPTSPCNAGLAFIAVVRFAILSFFASTVGGWLLQAVVGVVFSGPEADQQSLNT